MFRILLSGGGFFGLSCGLFMLIVLLITFNEGQVWAGYAIGILRMVGAFPRSFIVYDVKTNTNGNAPLWLIIIIALFLVTGLISFILGNV